MFISVNHSIGNGRLLPKRTILSPRGIFSIDRWAHRASPITPWIP